MRGGNGGLSSRGGEGEPSSWPARISRDTDRALNASRCGGVGNQRRLALIGLLVVIAISAILAGRLWGGEIAREPLALELPAPTLKGTPGDLPSGPNIEPLTRKARGPFLAPRGVKNVAAGKPVTSSVKPFAGELRQITDRSKRADDQDAVEFRKGTQWIQVDLGASFEIYALVLWHDHRYIQAIQDVILQVSNDPEFREGVTTMFNNDADNSSGQGMGTDREYFETAEGKLVDGKGVRARYVRSYTRGSSSGALNCWQELEVYALPAS